MKVAVVTPPEPVVRLAEAKAHLGVLHNEDDAIIQRCVAAATEILDGPDGWLGRSLGVQVVRVTLRGFPDEAFVLPAAPVSAINDVTYVDAAGVEREVDPELYDLTADGELELAYGKTWPATQDPRSPVQVLFTAGYTVLPETIRSAILILAADLYVNRESGTAKATAKALTTAECLVERYRFWRA